MEITGIISDALCVGQNSGKILAVIAGGAKPFNYKWEEIISTGSHVENLLKGNYTLIATDSAGCRAKQIFEVKEPVNPLVINSVKLNDIKCYGESGSIYIQASGSNGGNIYQYSKDNQEYIDYLSGAPLPSAAYKLKVKDSNGCETFWPENIIITRPPKALGLKSMVS